ncbi:hypothetical protein [Geodermatophilus sp. URMC 63]
MLDAQLPAERDGAVLVVFLPGGSATPRPGYDTAPLRVDARRRPLLGPALRTQLDLADNATIVARTDTERGGLELMPASRLAPQLDELFDSHRSPRRSTPPGAEQQPVPRLALPGGRMHLSPGATPSMSTVAPADDAN